MFHLKITTLRKLPMMSPSIKNKIVISAAINIDYTYIIYYRTAKQKPVRLESEWFLLSLYEFILIASSVVGW